MNPAVLSPDLALLKLIQDAFASGDVSSPQALYQWLLDRTNAEMNMIRGLHCDQAQQKAFTEMLCLAPMPQEIPASKPKKALNAFVANRTWLLRCPELVGLQMKQASGIVGVLWARSYERALWALIANAWSEIRDKYGKETVPLKKFLNIACPLLRITSPDDYFTKFGWKLIFSVEGTPGLISTGAPTLASFGPNAFTTTLSADDIIRHCHQVGLIPKTLLNNTVFTGLAPGQSFAMVASSSKRPADEDENNPKRPKLDDAEAPSEPEKDIEQILMDALRPSEAFSTVQQGLSPNDKAPQQQIKPHSTWENPVLERQARAVANTKAAWEADDIFELFGPDSKIVPANYDDDQRELAEAFPWDVTDLPSTDAANVAWDQDDFDFFNFLSED